MINSVVIKGNKYGIVLMLDENIIFEELKAEIAKKIKEASDFFGKKSIAISFEGRLLSDDEIKEILEIVSLNSQLEILTIVDQDQSREEKFKDALENKTLSKEIDIDIESKNTSFYKGTLRSGQEIKNDGNIVILGDVNPGARVVAGESVVVLGALKGIAFAGLSKENSFVIALEMQAMQIRIGDVMARGSDKPSQKEKSTQTKIAFLENGFIYIEDLTKELLNEI